MSDSPFDTDDFKRLKAQWDRKLRDSGFDDIEKPDGSLSDDSKLARVRAKSPTEIVATQDYYTRASQFSWTAKFRTPTDRQIWELHAAGKSSAEIARALSLHVSLIKRRIYRYRRIAALRPPGRSRPK